MKIKCENCGEERIVNEKWWKFAGEFDCGHCWKIISGGFGKRGWLIPYGRKRWR